MRLNTIPRRKRWTVIVYKKPWGHPRFHGGDDTPIEVRRAYFMLRSNAHNYARRCRAYMDFGTYFDADAQVIYGRHRAPNKAA